MAECFSCCAQALLGDDVSIRSEARPKNEARLIMERTLHAHRTYWPSLRDVPPKLPPSFQMPSDIPMIRNVAVDRAVGIGQAVTMSKEVSVRRGRNGRDRAPSGVPISTRNAAESNWKGDVKKLRRKQAELESTLVKIESLQQGVQAGAKCSRRDRGLIESEDELRLQLDGVLSELDDLNSLSKSDLIRMYTGA